uniref:hypothetical protein n=1 Tax=Rhodospora sordida TaxID=362230 RepID=UPI001FCE2B0E|nr:hypothetical protein MW557_pgp006 [Rhodospora sordida]UNJ15088.1 hypothetical protein [Rhodospora sordida]
MILIIDDDLNFRISLKSYLEEKNFVVVTLESSLQGINFLTQNLPDLIILDLMMPEVPGYDLLKFIRETLHLHYIPIIVLTAKSLAQDRIKAYSLGCNAYLSKPFNIDELLSIINNLMEHSKNYFYRLNFSPVLSKKILNSKNTSNSPINYIELTPKEQRTLNLVATGYMNKEIAKKLRISNRHVERYIARLFNQFSVNTRTELVKVAIQNAYITN